MSRVADELVGVGCSQKRSYRVTTVAGKKCQKAAFLRSIDLWFERSRQRRELRELIESSDETFKDIGISRYDVQREERKPFWRQ